MVISELQGSAHPHKQTLLSEFLMCFVYLGDTFIAGLFFFFCRIFWGAAPAACGGSQVRGRIGAVAVGLHHSSQQCWILNPLNKARDQTCVLMDAGQICFHWTTMGTPVASWGFLLFFCCFCFLGLHWQQMEVLRLGLESQPQQRGIQSVSATYTHSSWQHQILDPLSEVRDWTLILMDTSRVC